MSVAAINTTYTTDDGNFGGIRQCGNIVGNENQVHLFYDSTRTKISIYTDIVAVTFGYFNETK